MTLRLHFSGQTTKFPVDKLHSVDLEVENCDADFTLVAPRETERQPNGLLPAFILESEGLDCRFICRWDQNPEVVDVDMYKSGVIFSEFKSEKNGYVGHHAEKISHDPRKFRVDVQIPGKVIFQGVLTLNIGHTVSIMDLDRDIHIDADSSGNIIIT